MTDTRYPFLHVEVTPDDVDVMIGRLTMLGAEGIEERDASTLTKGGSLGVTLVASFPDDATAEAARDALAGEHPVHLDAIVGDAWRDAWKDHWQPTHLTDRVVVVPSWLTYDPAPGEMVMKLDPGRAFGTGQHPSTCLAARAVEARLPLLAGRPLLDLGCGSGILSFVALMQGATRAIGCDIDSESVACAGENAVALGLDARFEGRVGGVDTVPETSTLVVANIEAGVLIPLAEKVAAKVAPGGALVLSGVLVEQRAAVDAAYTAQGLVADDSADERGWIAPTYHRPG